MGDAQCRRCGTPTFRPEVQSYSIVRWTPIPEHPEAGVDVLIATYCTDCWILSVRPHL